MTNSEQKVSAQSASRKPRVSTAIDRKMVTRPVRSQSMIARNAEMVVGRSSTQSGQQMRQQMQQQQQSSQPQMRQALQQPMQKQTMSQQSERQSEQQSEQQMKQQMMQEKLMQVTNQRMQQRMSNQQTPMMKESAKQMKESAIEKALASASRTTEETKTTGVHFGFKRVLLAMAGAALGVFAIVYFVNLNAPNISLKVAAMQTGIEASYPAFVPRDYSLSDITSEVGKISLNFKHVTADSNFTIIEEKSSWDSNALLNNYVRYEYGEDYTILREQGLTLYVSNSSAAWVNGGIVYKLIAPANTLTKKQIKSIAVSL